MLSILQTNFNGIDALEKRSLPKPNPTADDVLIQMTTWPVVPTDWKRESNPEATAEQLDSLPRVIGIGGVGRITEVGTNRDPQLLNQRVLVMNPAGSYSEYITSSNPDFIFPIPDSVSDESAAALTAGTGTAAVLRHHIEMSAAEDVIITGANSVIGIYLLQLLAGTDKHLRPVVSPASRKYFQEQLPSQPVYTLNELPTDLPAKPLVIDIAGSTNLLTDLLDRYSTATVISIALTEFPTAKTFKFVHEDFDADQYRQFMSQLATGDLHAPIDRVFAFTDVKAAQHYAQDSHSRGRVLVSNQKGSF